MLRMGMITLIEKDTPSFVRIVTLDSTVWLIFDAMR